MVDREATQGSDSTPPGRANERATVDRLIRTIVERCPRRQAGSEQEAQAQQILEEDLVAAGLRTELAPFRFSTNLYAVLALHGLLGCAGSVLLVAGQWPAAALALHLLAGLSLGADVGRFAYLLRRLLPWRGSVNLIGKLPARGEPRLRVAVVGHIDAAFTGLLFHPKTIQLAAHKTPPGPLRFLRKTMVIPVGALLILAGLDGVLLAGGDHLALRLVGAGLSIPVLLAFLFNAEIVLRHELVPGANDNLTACAALPVLARRLAPDKPDDVELLFISTGAEEAGTGGAYQLARAMRGVWATEQTVILVLDSLSGGDLRFFEEGELYTIPIAPWLRALVEELAGDPRFAEVRPLDIPAGASDALPFLRHGFTALGLGCADPVIGAPLHYHRPSDTPDNLDLDKILYCIDFAELLLRRIVETQRAALPS